MARASAFEGDAEKSWQMNKTVDKWATSLTQPKETSMLWTIIVILVVLWLLGFIGHVGGGLIHLLLVIAVVVLVINLIQGRRGL
jgi:membrane protein required for beta-lactamase induction